MQVWKLDYFGRSELVAYGFTHIPSIAGEVEIGVTQFYINF